MSRSCAAWARAWASSRWACSTTCCIAVLEKHDATLLPVSGGSLRWSMRHQTKHQQVHAGTVSSTSCSRSLCSSTSTWQSRRVVRLWLHEGPHRRPGLGNGAVAALCSAIRREFG